MNTTSSMTSATYQTQLTDESYNGWTNYATWNVALWLQNDPGFYDLARMYRHHGYKSLSHVLTELRLGTPDGIEWCDEDLNICELDEMLEDL